MFFNVVSGPRQVVPPSLCALNHSPHKSLSTRTGSRNGMSIRSLISQVKGMSSLILKQFRHCPFITGPYDPGSRVFALQDRKDTSPCRSGVQGKSQFRIAIKLVRISTLHISLYPQLLLAKSTGTKFPGSEQESANIFVQHPVWRFTYSDPENAKPFSSRTGEQIVAQIRAPRENFLSKLGVPGHILIEVLNFKSE